MKIELRGVKELSAALKALPENIQAQAVSKALRASAQPIADAASGMAPRLTGQLARSVVVTTSIVGTQRDQSRKPRKYEVRVFIGPSYSRNSANYAPHAHLQEFGTGPRWQQSTGRFTGQTPAHPFLRPAWDAGKGPLVAEFGPQLGLQVERAAKRVAKRAGTRGDALGRGR